MKTPRLLTGFRRILFHPGIPGLILLTAGPVSSLHAQVVYTNGQDDTTPRSTTSASPLTLTIDSGTATQSGAISGDGSITKTGDGTLRLTASNSHSGGTIISEGTLAITSTAGAGAVTGSVSIAAGATLDLGAQNMGLAGGLAPRISGEGTVTTTGAFNNGSSSSFTRGFALGGTASLNHTGTGTLILTGTSTYTGTTSVSNGTLRVDGSIATSSTVTVQSTGTLAGTGTVGDLSLSGTLAPGHSPGTLTVDGNTTWNGGATYLWEINDANGAAGSAYDLVSIFGTLTLAATPESKFKLSLASLTAGNEAGTLAGFDAAQDYTYTIASASGGILGFDAGKFTIDSSGFTNALAGGLWSLAVTGNDLTLNFAAATAVPEPSTYAALAGLGALGLALYRRRR